MNHLLSLRARRRARRSSPHGFVVALALLLGLTGAVTAPSAHAGTATIYSCSTKSGAANPTIADAGGGWSSSVAAGGRADNLCGIPGGYLYVEQQGPVAAGTNSRWIYTPPANTAVTGYSGSIYTYTALRQVNNQGVAQLQDDGGLTYQQVGAGSIGWVPISLTGRWSASFSMVAYCDGPGGTTCPAGIMAAPQMGGFRVRQQDDIAPSVSGVSGTATTATRWIGGQTLNFAASDLGLGVKDFVVAVDGTPKITRTINNNSGACVDLGTYEYNTPRPCPLSVTDYETIDSSQLPEGAHTVTAYVTDAVGNATTIMAGRAVQIDNVPPPGAASNVAVTGGSGWHAANDFEVTWTNPTWAYPIAKAGYLLCPGSNPFAVDCLSGSQSTNNINTLSHVAVPSAGTWSLWLTLEDDSGPTTLANTADPVFLRFDGAAPAAPTAQRDNGWLSATQSAVVTRSITPPASQPTSGLAGYSYTTDGTVPDDSIDVYGTSPTVELRGLPEGSVPLKVRAVSNSGVASSTVDTSIINIDRTAPAVAAVSAPAQGAWSDHSVSFDLQASDPGSLSGMAAAPGAQPITSGAYLEYRLDGGAWAQNRGALATVVVDTDGAHQVAYRAVDVAGNVGEIQTRTVRVDTQAPAAPTVSGSDGGWLGASGTSAAAATFTAPSPGVSGLAGLSFTTDGSTPDSTPDVAAARPFSWQLPAGADDGTYTLKVRAISGSGIAGPIATRTLAIDRIAPTVDVADAPDPQAWQTVAVTLHVTGHDATSGVDHLQVKTDAGSWQTIPADSTAIELADDGQHTVALRAIDVAGNTSDAQTHTVRVDRTAPQAPTIAAQDGWLNATQAAGDARALSLPVAPASGLAGYSITTDATDPDASVELGAGGTWRGAGQLPDGTFTLKARAISGAGLFGPITASTVRVDRLPPTVTIDGAPQPGRWSAEPITLTLTGTDQDGLSGLTGAPDDQPATAGGRLEASVDGDSWQAFRGDHAQLQIADDGRHTVQVRAIDLAGNLSTQQTAVVLLDHTPPTGQPFHAAQDGSKITVALADDTSGLLTAVIEVHPQDADPAATSALRAAATGNGWKALPTAFDGDNATADLAAAGLPAGAYDVRVRVRDLAGNEALWTGSPSSTHGTTLKVSAPTAASAAATITVTAPAATIHDVQTIHDTQTVTTTVHGGPAAGSLLSAAACTAHGRGARCALLLFASQRQTASGHLLVLRIDSRTALGAVTFTLPKGIAPAGRRPVAIQQIALNGLRRTSRLTGRGLLHTTAPGDPLAVRARPGQLRLRGLAASTGAIQLTIPITAAQAAALAGHTIHATTGIRQLYAQLPGRRQHSRR